MKQDAIKFSSYMTVRDAARYLGVSPATLRNWDKNGKLKPYRHPINGYRLYLKSDLTEILAELKTGRD